MAFQTYIAHLDARIREALEEPGAIALLVGNDATARWTAGERYVTAGLSGASQVAFLLYTAPDPLPYDRFSDDLDEPDVASSARKISEFFIEGTIDEGSIDEG